jgi:hypothetical protein
MTPCRLLRTYLLAFCHCQSMALNGPRWVTGTRLQLCYSVNSYTCLYSLSSRLALLLLASTSTSQYGTVVLGSPNSVIH